jgi:hypothetical protein
MPAIAIAFVSVASRVAPKRRDQVAGRHLHEDRDDGQQQEGEDAARREDERRPEEAVYCVGLGSGRNP